MSSASTQPPDSAPGSGPGWFPKSLVVWIVFALSLVALSHGLGRVPLMWPDEGRNAEVAREMKEDGRWLIPTYNGADYLDKPAFYFKAVALSLAAFGDTEFAARLPSMASGLALLLLTFAFCRRLGTERFAALAVLVIATTPLFLAYSRIVIFDITLTLFTCGAIFAGYLAEESDGVRRRNWYMLGAFAAGLGTLVKGPVGFILPALVLLVFNRVDGRRGSFRRILSPLNLLVFFGTVLPWFIGVSLANPDFPRYGIVEESFRRFTTGSFQRSKPFYFYPLIIATTFFPWSFLLPGGAIVAWRHRSGWARIDRLCIVWTLVVLVFFSLSNSKMPGYILSLTISLGILIARLFDRALDLTRADLRRVPLQAVALLAMTGTVGALVAMRLSAQPSWLESRLRLEAWEVEQWQQALVPLAVFLGSVAVVSAFALIRKSVRISFAALAGFALAGIFLNLGMLQIIAAGRSAHGLVGRLKSEAPGATVACLECLPHGLPFYLGRTVPVLTRDGGELSSNYVLFSLKTLSSWPATLIPVSSRDAWLDRQKEAVVLVARNRSRAVLDQIAAERGGRVMNLPEGYCALLLPPRAAA